MAADEVCDLARPDTRAWNFILGDETGHEIDFHVIVLDEDARESTDQRSTGLLPRRGFPEPAR